MGKEIVSNNIRNKRNQAKLTQEETALAAGVTRQTIIAMEKGNYIPSVLLALKLSEIFKCKVEDLFYVEKS